MSRLLPAVADVRGGARDTGLLLLLRWRLLRGAGQRVLVVLGLVALAGVLGSAMRVGPAVWTLARAGTATTAGQFATNYVVSLQRGDLGFLGATALTAAAAASLISPLTGAATVALASPADLAGIRPARLHAYFDTIVTTSISTIGFLQLVGLTAVASLLTLDGDATVALLTVWLMWPALILLTVAFVWGLELVHRVGVSTAVRAARGVVLTGLAAIAAIAVLAVLAGLTVLAGVGPGRDATPWRGLGGAFAQALRLSGQGDPGRAGAILAVSLAVSVGLLLAGLALCHAALARPARTTARRARSHRGTLATRPQLALAQILVRQMARTTEVRRPILAVVLLGVPAVWISGGDRLVMTTLVLATPLAVALAWGVNAFGVIGSAMPWLASQPRLMRRLLWQLSAVQVAVVVVLAVLCWGPAWLAGIVDSRDLASIGAGLAVSTAVTTRSAATKAVVSPYRTRLGEGSDVIVPPLAAISYALRFSLWGGQFGVLVSTRNDGLVQVALVCAALVWSGTRYAVLLSRWRDRVVQSYVVATVAAS